jgi:hypothetical protein
MLLKSNGSNSHFDNILARHTAIYVIVSPPRCSSTAFARVFWEHPDVGYYSHEPFEIVYYNGANLAMVASKMEQPLDLRHLKPQHNAERLPGWEAFPIIGFHGQRTNCFFDPGPQAQYLIADDDEETGGGQPSVPARGIGLGADSAPNTLVRK